MHDPFTHVDVYLVLRRGDEVLLGMRLGERYGAGEYLTPAGKLDPGESMLAALVREAEEEVGIHLDPLGAKLVHVLHFHGWTDRLGMFFEVWDWRGEIANTEPEKCAGWEWHPVHDLPTGLMAYARHALTCALNGIPQSTYGWGNETIHG